MIYNELNKPNIQTEDNRNVRVKHNLSAGLHLCDLHCQFYENFLLWPSLKTSYDQILLASQTLSVPGLYSSIKSDGKIFKQ